MAVYHHQHNYTQLEDYINSFDLSLNRTEKTEKKVQQMQLIDPHKATSPALNDDYDERITVSRDSLNYTSNKGIQSTRNTRPDEPIITEGGLNTVIVSSPLTTYINRSKSKQQQHNTHVGSFLFSDASTGKIAPQTAVKHNDLSGQIASPLSQHLSPHSISRQPYKYTTSAQQLPPKESQLTFKQFYEVNKYSNQRPNTSRHRKNQSTLEKSRLLKTVRTSKHSQSVMTEDQEAEIERIATIIDYDIQDYLPKFSVGGELISTKSNKNSRFGKKIDPPSDNESTESEDQENANPNVSTVKDKSMILNLSNLSSVTIEERQKLALMILQGSVPDQPESKQPPVYKDSPYFFNNASVKDSSKAEPKPQNGSFVQPFQLIGESKIQNANTSLSDLIKPAEKKPEGEVQTSFSHLYQPYEQPKQVFNYQPYKDPSAEGEVTKAIKKQLNNSAPSPKQPQKQKLGFVDGIKLIQREYRAYLLRKKSIKVVAPLKESYQSPEVKRKTSVVENTKQEGRKQEQHQELLDLLSTSVPAPDQTMEVQDLTVQDGPKDADLSQDSIKTEDLCSDLSTEDGITWQVYDQQLLKDEDVPLVVQHLLQ